MHFRQIDVCYHGYACVSRHRKASFGNLRLEIRRVCWVLPAEFRERRAQRIARDLKQPSDRPVEL
jgi:hypothetical protein